MVLDQVNQLRGTQRSLGWVVFGAAEAVGAMVGLLLPDYSRRRVAPTGKGTNQRMQSLVFLMGSIGILAATLFSDLPFATIPILGAAGGFILFLFLRLAGRR